VGKLKVFLFCNYSSLPDELTGYVQHGSIPCLSGKENLILTLVDYCVKRAVRCLEMFMHKTGQIEVVVLLVTSLNCIFRGERLDT
jgi:hypothetical protein